ncbi:hypothetical protein OG562_43135 [Streptomyces sp. NBC_01275]|uniref:hypothetical protein n=1 Tax=Streptomyces sp. NBC_01275 TaxID=2903807 RepID=UPI0022516F7D|nr:hypothetical protein [Streptomyces sp. NBC_01275]MCX4767635.1 hypothetical protein [Streptomyces sp. NBC_01275]
MARRQEEARAAESASARRRRTVRELRAAGRYGPRLREVLPALTGLVVVVCAAVVGLTLVSRVYGGWAGALVLVPLAVVAVVVRRLSRRPARRRSGYYTAQELAELDMPALVLAVARMLRRDGWRVLPPPRHDALHLAAHDGRGRVLDVAFRPVAEPLPGEDTACSCRPRVRRRAGPPLRLVVHRGTFTHRDEVWAAREGRTFLIDGPRLRLWALGTPLAQLAVGAAPSPRRT